MRSAYAILLILLSLQGFTQERTSFNDQWSFIQGADTSIGKWSTVQVPHTWNAEDPFDKDPGYYRGLGWYQKKWDVANAEDGKRRYLHFEASNQETDVLVNGELAGTHLGGYTAFSVELTTFLKSGENTITVKVNNRHDERVPPLKGDFNFYGGIYRDVWLYELDPIHFELSEYGDHGIFITTPQVTSESATVQVRTNISNQTREKRKVTIKHILYDRNGNQVAQQAQRRTLNEDTNTLTVTLSDVTSPELWHPNTPNLYRLVSEIRTRDGKLLDQQSNSVGFRWFRFDSNQGFFLNGRHLKLLGTNRHQDYKGLGNALSDDRHLTDIQQIKDMGSNFFRTAHYPQDPAVLDAADRLGLVVSMEIPLDHEITDSPEFLDNSKRMLVEMIRQHYNHPSVVVWAYMNEMMLGRKWERDQAIIEKIRLQAIELEELTRAEDPNRYTMIPNHGDLDLYIKAGLTKIPMIVGWNLYFGWYEGDGEGAGKFLDKFHELVPDKPVLITEYGAGADPRIRSLVPERFDFSIDWQNAFHQSNLLHFTQRDFIAGAAIWNIADFGSEGRNDADPKINSKGVVGMDRIPKDAFYLYQSWLREDPLIRIGSKNWSKRIIRMEGGKLPTHPIEVYSNQQEVELFLNQQSLGKKQVVNHIALWNVGFTNGLNHLEAKSTDGSQVADWANFDVQVIKPGEVDWSQGVNINCGSTFHFSDESNGINWLPDMAYAPGLWGYQGGEMYRPRDRGIGSDLTINNTDKDPVYQTVRSVNFKYIFDIKPGNYELILHWAEVDRAYQESDTSRAFHVIANGTNVISDLDIRNAFGFATAGSKKIQLQIEGNSLNLEFKKITGSPIINGIQIRKLN